MNVPLPSLPARLVLVVCSCALALFLVFFSVRNAVAAYFVDLDTRDGYERAVRLEPHNSRNWYLLGRSYFYDFEQADLVRAVAALRHAADLDPYSAAVLLDLAAAYESEGQTEQARYALVSAQRVYPLSADVAWSYGNFLLRQGKYDAGFAELRKALELDPKRVTEAVGRALAFEPDPSVVLDKVVPRSTATYLPLLTFESDSGNAAVAQLVWVRLVSLGQKVPLSDVLPFFRALVSGDRPEDAARLWPQAVGIMANPPPPDPSGSLIWDGGFESGVAGGGLGWLFSPVSGDAQISFDRSEKHSGQQSLRILFNGRRNISFADGCHLFVPQPGRLYVLTGWVKTQSLTSSEGVRLEIRAASRTGEVAALSGEIHGTQPWSELRVLWKAPEDSGLGKVCVKRNMSDKPGSAIQGAAWIDDVALVPFAAAEQAPLKP
jgi:hypothetical protein